MRPLKYQPRLFSIEDTLLKQNIQSIGEGLGLNLTSFTQLFLKLKICSQHHHFLNSKSSLFKRHQRWLLLPLNISSHTHFLSYRKGLNIKSYLEIVNLFIFGNLLVFFQSCSSNKWCQLRISKEFQRLPDCHRRLLRTQFHSQGCYQ